MTQLLLNQSNINYDPEPTQSTQDVRSPGFQSHFEVENDPDPRSSYLDVVFENVVKGSEGEAPCQSMAWGVEDPTNTVEDAKDWVDADENDEEVGGNPSNGGAGESRVEPDSGKVELCDVIEPCATTPSGGGGLDSEQPTSTTSSPVIRQSRPASECSSHSTSSNEYLVCDDHSDMTRHKSMMTQRPGNRKKLLKPSWSSPPPNGGVPLGEFVSQREKHYSGNSPVQRSKSSESPSENESDNPFLLSNFVKGRRHNNNHSNNVDHKQELTSMWNKIFMDASKRGDVSKMEQAHEKGADLYMRDSEGCTALHHAVRFAHTDVVDFMITKGGSKILNLLDTHRKQTALHKAAWYGRMDICIKLVEAGSLLHITDYKGKTAMERAKQSDSAELVEYLNNSHSGPTSLKNCLETDL